MKKFIHEGLDEWEREDVDRLVQVCADNDIDIDPDDAYIAWRHLSDDYDVSWLSLPLKASEVVEKILPYIKEIE